MLDQANPAKCRKLPIAEFVAKVARDGLLHDVVYQYTGGTLAASSQQSASNAHHSMDERCARWQLMCHAGAGVDKFPLADEILYLPQVAYRTWHSTRVYASVHYLRSVPVDFRYLRARPATATECRP